MAKCLMHTGTCPRCAPGPVLNGGVPNNEDVMYGPDIKIDRKKFQPYLHIFIDTKY